MTKQENYNYFKELSWLDRGKNMGLCPICRGEAETRDVIKSITYSARICERCGRTY